MSWRNVRGSPGRRGCGGSQFSRLLLQNRREKEQSILGHPFISWRVKPLKKTNNWIPVIILNKALIEETNLTCLGGRFVQYFLFPDLMTRRMLRFSRAWEREEGGILVSSPRSGCPVRSHENAASSVQTSFFAIEYLLSRVSWMSQPCVLFALALSQIGKCQSFLETPKLLNCWMNYKWAQKHLSNSLRTSHVPLCQSWDEQ